MRKKIRGTMLRDRDIFLTGRWDLESIESTAELEELWGRMVDDIYTKV